MSGVFATTYYLSKMSSSCAFAAAATIFYKKTFKEDKLSIVGCLACLGLFLENILRQPLFCSVGCSVSTAILLYLCNKDREWLKSAGKLDFFVSILLTVLDARFNIVGMLGLPIPYWINVRIFAAALPQFLRKPLWVKQKLQDVRSKLGPIYILYLSTYVLARDASNPQWLQQIGYLAVLSSVVAGVCFRPDNSAVLDVMGPIYCGLIRLIAQPDNTDEPLEPYRSKMVERRYYHGRLMMCSFGLCSILSVADIFFR